MEVNGKRRSGRGERDWPAAQFDAQQTVCLPNARNDVFHVDKVGSTAHMLACAAVPV